MNVVHLRQARIFEDLRMKIACARAPDGRTHVASLDLDLKGSAMMQSFSQSDRGSGAQKRPAGAAKEACECGKRGL